MQAVIKIGDLVVQKHLNTNVTLTAPGLPMTLETVIFFLLSVFCMI